MARIGFRTVGSCIGHQVTAAQLALLPGWRRELAGRNLFWGGSGGCEGLKKCWRCLDAFNPRLTCTSFSYPSPGKCSFSERGCELWGAESLRKRGCSPTPSPEQDLLPDAGRPATLPPALVAGTDLPSFACCSLPDSHQVD